MEQVVLDKSNKHIKDFKLAIEYKYLMKQAPAGVYLLPEYFNIRKLHGVIFVRRGLYRNGVFRFIVNLPDSYNDTSTYPEIFFSSPIPFNPLIDPITGQFDLKLDPVLLNNTIWDPEKHFIATAITCLKKLFYYKSYDMFSFFPNQDAYNLFTNDKAEFVNKINKDVRDSLSQLYDNNNSQSSSCTLLFTEPKPAHEVVLKRVLYQINDNNLTNNNDNTNNDN